MSGKKLLVELSGRADNRARLKFKLELFLKIHIFPAAVQVLIKQANLNTMEDKCLPELIISFGHLEI